MVQSFRSNPYEGKKVIVPKTKKNCKNEKVKNEGYYIGRRETGEEFSFRFVARLKWDEDYSISKLNADQGECNDLWTHKDYQKCGIT